ncbi:MAG: hypothetical protein COB26_10365 [Piscirickettsiaceae bacterium]|nr:MAG: hypothetical protein COB26_10365 [Piscirickettsiaceae bacterium]
MDKKIIPIIGYGLAGAVFALVSAYFFLYNPEVYENRRFIDSFKRPIAEAKGEPKKLQALQTLQKKGVEWAHYQLVGSIKNHDYAMAKLYIDAGMRLRDKDLVIGQMIENPKHWFELIRLLRVDTKEGLSGLFHVPRYLTAFDERFDLVETRYAIPHTVAFKDHYLLFITLQNKWIQEKNKELASVDEMCEGNTRCVAVNVPAIQIEYDKKKPIAPEKDLILWQNPYLSLMSAAILLGDRDIINYLESKGVTSRLNKVEMSDLAIVVFEVSRQGEISYPEGITVNKPKRGKRRAGPQTG